MNNNRMWNVKNQAQGKYKRVLCVCSAGLLRSPTAAVVLANKPFHYNTRAVGMAEDYALIRIDDILIEWADEIVVFEDPHERHFKSLISKPIINLKIPDNYEYRDKKLMKLIRDRYLLREKEKQK